MSFLTLTPLPHLSQGNTGVLLGLLLVSFVILVALITVLSGIGVAEHCGMGSGGVYSMISSVLGGQTGATVGLLYVFGQVRLRHQPTPLPLHHRLPSSLFPSSFDLGEARGDTEDHTGL